MQVVIRRCDRIPVAVRSEAFEHQVDQPAAALAEAGAERESGAVAFFARLREQVARAMRQAWYSRLPPPMVPWKAVAR